MPLPVRIDVAADRSVGRWRPIWNWFGYDESNYTYLPNGRRLLADLAALHDGPVYARAHNLLTSGDGTPSLKWGSTGIYGEDGAGRPVYSWAIMDRIFDAYVGSADDQQFDLRLAELGDDLARARRQYVDVRESLDLLVGQVEDA